MKRLIVKDDGLAGSSNAPTGYKYLGYDGAVYSEKEGAVTSPIGAYKEWTAIIRQTGTNNPTLTVVKNSLGVTVTAARAGQGQYLLSGFNSLLTGTNYIIERHLSLASYLHIALFTTESSSSIGIGTYASDAFADDILFGTDTVDQWISVKVYN